MKQSKQNMWDYKTYSNTESAAKLLRLRSDIKM